MKKHNGIISLLKFIFCILIVIFHIGESFSKKQSVLFVNGAIGVEFFFLVSGYLMAKKAFQNSEETHIYIWKKIKTFFPYILIAFLISMVSVTALKQFTIKQYILSIWDLLLLRYTGLKSAGVLMHLWYLSAMLICMALIYPQIKKFEKKYFYWIAPLTVLFLAGYINQNIGNLKDPQIWLGFSYRGMSRAYLDLCLGTLLFPLVEKLKKIDFTKISRMIFTIIISIGTIMVIIVANMKTTDYDFVLLLILSIIVTLAFCEEAYGNNLLNNKFVYFLEKLSLPIYCVHLPIRNFVRDASKLYKLNLNYNSQLLIILLSSIVIGGLALVIVEIIKTKKFKKLKSIFINAS